MVKSHQIPIDAFVAALRMMKVEDIDQDETQCIIANLIYEGKIKGYISHQHQKLVVSKQNAFPPLAATSWKDISWKNSLFAVSSVTHE